MIISILTTIFTQDPNRPSVITTARRDREQEDKENKGHKREMTIVEGEKDGDDGESGAVED